MIKGKIITVEGIDGAGKSFFIDYIKDSLKNFKRFKVLYQREPGGTEIGEQIRKLLLTQDMLPMTELLLYLGSRYEAVNKVYLPHLKSEKSLLLLDRFLDSSIIYQGIGRKLSVQLIIDIHKMIKIYLQPTLTLLFYCDLEIVKQRNKKNNLDRIEKMGDVFFNELQQSYLKIAKENKERVVVIDNSESVESTKNQINQALINI